MIPILEAKADIEKLYNYVQNDEVVDKFFNIKQRLKSPYNDIYYWLKREPAEFINYVNSLSDESNTQLRKLAKQGADLFYYDDNWKVYHINTYEASVYYGKGTKWCISGNELRSKETGRYYFNKYKKERQNCEYYFYINNDGRKYALMLYGLNNDKYELFNSVGTNMTHGVDDMPEVESLPILNTEFFNLK